MEKQDKIRINEMVCNLIVKTMEAGANYEQAKKHALKKLYEESPIVHAAWVAAITV